MLLLRVNLQALACMPSRPDGVPLDSHHEKGEQSRLRAVVFGGRMMVGICRVYIRYQALSYALYGQLSHFIPTAAGGEVGTNIPIPQGGKWRLLKRTVFQTVAKGGLPALGRRMSNSRMPTFVWRLGVCTSVLKSEYRDWLTYFLWLDGFTKGDSTKHMMYGALLG